MGTRFGHLELLVGSTDQYLVPDALLPAADVPHDGIFFCSGSGVVVVVDAEPQASGLLDDASPQLRALLADPAREHERVHLPAQRHVVRADVAADAVREQVEGQLLAPLGGFVAVFAGRRRRRRRDGREVRSPRQRVPAALLVEDLLGPRDVQIPRRRGRELAYVAAGVVEYEAGFDPDRGRERRRSA